MIGDIGMPRLNGRRGAFLVLFGTVNILLGVAFTLPSQPSSSIRFLLDIGVPMTAWGAVWVASGVVGIGFAFARPPGADRWGFVALAAALASGTGVYTMSWVLGYGRGWLLASVFAALTGAVAIVSGMMSATTVLTDSQHRTGDD